MCAATCGRSSAKAELLRHKVDQGLLRAERGQGSKGAAAVRQVALGGSSDRTDGAPAVMPNTGTSLGGLPSDSNAASGTIVLVADSSHLMKVITDIFK